VARARKKATVDNRKVAVYVRKSKLTETGKSIEVQKEKCIALASAQFDSSEEDILIYEDEGKSGFYADRPHYKRMLKDIEDNKIKAVVCYKIDRISRRTVDLLNLVQQMEQKGIAFVSVSDREIDTSSRTGKIMIALLSAIAEFERDIIAERVTDNLYELAKEGRWLGGKCPLGYSSKKETIVENGRKSSSNFLEPVEDEQIAVKRLFELFIQTNTYSATFETLNKEGFRTREGKEFTRVAIKDIMTNPVYAIADADMRSYFTLCDVPIWADDNDFDGVRGIMAYNKTEQVKELDEDSRALDPRYVQRVLRRDIKEWVVSVGKHKGILKGADWIRIQNLMMTIYQDNAARPKEVSRALLSGLIRCITCGGKMYVRAETRRYNPDGSVRFRYICDDKYRGKGGCKVSPNIKGYEIDNFVVDQICNMSMGEGAFYGELLNTKNILAAKSLDAEKEINVLRKRLAQIELDTQNQVANLRSAPEDIRQAIYSDIEALNKERDEKQERLDAISEDVQTHENQIADIEKAKQAIMDFPRLMELVDYEGKLQLLRRIVECVIVKGDIVHIFLKGSEVPPSFTKAQERSDVCHTDQNSIIYTMLCDTSEIAYFRDRILYHLTSEMRILEENASVAERIRFYRTKRNLSSDMLAELIGMSRFAVMDYENELTEPLLTILKKIAVALDIDPDKLYDDYYRFLDYPYTERIRLLRKEHNLTQKELGAMLGVTRHTVERWEHGVNYVTRDVWNKLLDLNLA